MTQFTRSDLIIFIGFFLCLTPSLLTAQFDLKEPIKVGQLGLSTDRLEEMNEYFHSLVDQQQLAGVQIGIIKSGHLAFYDTYGFADIENKRRLNDHSLFRIFSMTKPIVSVALMQLFEQGKFQLDDKVEMYLPELKNRKVYFGGDLMPAQNPLTIRDLLRHSSGYSYGNTEDQNFNNYYREANLYAAKDNEDFVRRLSSIPLLFEPGTDWNYGISTTVCGRLVEVFSGQSLANYLEQHIFQPLEMNHTYFQIPEDEVDNFTVGYRWNGEELFISESATENRYRRPVTFFNGGGGLVSNMKDYLNFCQMLLNKGKTPEGRILQEETIQLMFSDQLVEVRSHQDEALSLPPGEGSFGLGFAIKGEPEQLQKKYGWGGAVGTYFKVDLDNDMAYVMMIQISPYRHLGLRQRLQDYINDAIIH